MQASVAAIISGLLQSIILQSRSPVAPGEPDAERARLRALDAAFGEQYDDGVNDNSYGSCSDSCGLGPRCGDGTTNGAEECDDGSFITGDGCNLACEIERQVVPA